MYPHSFLKSFQYAWNGFTVAVKEERNLRFHLVAGFFVLWFSRFYHFSRGIYAILALAIGGVIALELVNSSIERAVARPGPERFFITGVVKDMAAAAVLLYSIGAAVAGIILFWQPEVLYTILNYYISSPLRIVLLFTLVIAGCSFIFRKEEPPFEDR